LINVDKTWPRILWQQFGAALDMLGDALQACPDELWREQLWEEATESPQYGEVWFVIYHTLHWVDLYLHGAVEGFARPARFERYERGPDGVLPATPYTREDLQAYFDDCRQKCRETFEALTVEKADAPCRLRWLDEEMTYLELQLYSMRHVQEHAAQLNLMLGQKSGAASDWVPRARTLSGANAGYETDE
jgi:hypothetical protein